MKMSESDDQLSLLGEHPELAYLPSAKVKGKDKAGVHGWTNFYASFSEKFVDSALSAMGVSDGEAIFDPFVGSGTTLVVALKRGLPAIGVDLDPFACLLARAKVAINADSQEVSKILGSTSRKAILPTFLDDAVNLFDQECLVYASSVFQKLASRLGEKRENVLSKILSDRFGRFDSEAVALAALCIAAPRSAKVIRGSNPTWYRRAQKGEEGLFERLQGATKSLSVVMLRDLEGLALLSGKRDILVVNADCSADEIQAPNLIRADVIVTSPPYLTRLDYVVKHLPNLLLLSGLFPVDINDLRKKMIGTPKIVDKGDVSVQWGRECLRVIDEIRGHQSYASDSYYVWTYYQYFKSAYQSLKNLRDISSNAGRGVLVVQDSYYKNLRIPLSDIMAEMLVGLSFSAKVVKKDVVGSHMKYISPRQQENAKNKKLSEDVVYFHT